VKHKVALPIDGLTRERLPAICPLSGATEGLVWRKVSVAWLPSGLAAAIPLGLLFAVMAASAARGSHNGELPFRPGAWWRWKLAEGVQLVAWIFAIPTFLGSLVGLGTEQFVVGAVMLVLSVGAIMGAQTFLDRSGLMVHAMDNGVIVLRIPNEQAARALSGLVPGAALRLSLDAARTLEEAARKTTPAPDRTRCAYHPDTLAVWCCGRCGSFFCPRCAAQPSKDSNAAVCVKCFDAAQRYWKTMGNSRLSSRQVPRFCHAPHQYVWPKCRP
jgi:hypothetical protein